MRRVTMRRVAILTRLAHALVMLPGDSKGAGAQLLIVSRELRSCRSCEREPLQRRDHPLQ
jgi:hypothetical protein